VGQALNRHPDLFAEPTLAPAQVAIAVNEWNYQLCRSMELGAEHLGFSVRGWHRMLWDAGIAVDFVEVNEPNAESWARYKALILPFPMSMSEEVAGRLAEYVEAGGNLVSEACPGRMDEHAWPTRGQLSPRMRQLFGVRHERLTMVREPGDGMRWSVPERSWGDYLDACMLEGAGPLGGRRLRANVRLQTLVCEGSEPVLKHGDAVAGTVRAAGTGRAWLLGTFVGHNGTAYRDRDTRTAVSALLEQCGVRPEHAGKLLLRRRVTPQKEAWLFINPTEETVAEPVDVAGWRNVSDLFNEPLSREADTVPLSVDSLDVRVLVLER
jgi:hypothetical protein